MKKILFASCLLLLTSIAHADNIFAYDDAALATFRDVHADPVPPPPITYVEIENAPSVVPPSPATDFEAGVQAQEVAREIESTRKTLENIDRNNQMKQWGR